MIDDDGYAWPVHRALTEPTLLAGVPRKLAILLWITTAALVFNLNSTGSSRSASDSISQPRT